MALLPHLNETTLMASSVVANQPDSDRLVVLQDRDQGKVVSVSARYRDGRWYGEWTGDDLTDGLSRDAIWFESYLV